MVLIVLIDPEEHPQGMAPRNAGFTLKRHGALSAVCTSNVLK